jgi:hypothetical protein
MGELAAHPPRFFSEPGPWNAVIFVPAAAAYSYLASVVEAGWLLLLDG